MLLFRYTKDKIMKFVAKILGEKWKKANQECRKQEKTQKKKIKKMKKELKKQKQLQKLNLNQNEKSKYCKTQR